MNKKINVEIRNAVANKSNIMFIDPHDSMCVDELCDTMTNDYKFLYSDSTNLSKDDAKILWSKIGEKTKKFIS